MNCDLLLRFSNLLATEPASDSGCVKTRHAKIATNYRTVCRSQWMRALSSVHFASLDLREKEGVSDLIECKDPLATANGSVLCDHVARDLFIAVPLSRVLTQRIRQGSSFDFTRYSVRCASEIANPTIDNRRSAYAARASDLSFSAW